MAAEEPAEGDGGESQDENEEYEFGSHRALSVRRRIQGAAAAPVNDAADGGSLGSPAAVDPRSFEAKEPTAVPWARDKDATEGKISGVERKEGWFYVHGTQPRSR